MNKSISFAGNYNARYNEFQYWQGDAPRNTFSHDDWMKYSDYSCIYPEKGVNPPHVGNAKGIPRAWTGDGECLAYVFPSFFLIMIFWLPWQNKGVQFNFQLS